MGVDHIKELLSGLRTSRLVLVVSDLVSDLEVLVLPVHRLVLNFFLNLRAPALHSLFHLEFPVQLACQLTDLPSILEPP